MPDTIILALNSGSSSLKFGLFTASHDEVRPLCSGAAEGIGSNQGRFWIHGAKGEVLKDEPHAFAKQEEAVRAVAEASGRLPFPAPAAIGHRIVHGGPKLREHQKITPEVLTQLEAAASFAPLHVPIALSMIRQAQQHFPGVPQFACFDTAFHRTMPEAASRFALPRKFWDAGVRRYGFHGLSCESVLHRLGADVPPRMIIAHLGNGASITAIANGASIDTTMGLTPTGGIVMSTRTGDLDPGVLLYILRTSGSHVEELEELLDKESGLLGISGISGDMRLLHQTPDDPALCAVEIFCRTAKKAIGAFIAILGGLDLLVFTAGIGEHDAGVRAQICSGLDSLGIVLDSHNNESNSETISSEASRVLVRVLPSEEEIQIARNTYRLLSH
ncbi:MAG TPA: acetate/propionate family kinase [Candidatus Acidoferrales bacterium]|nr:acetate/propionate family kinase [Candidatus Acidoferrales bacterium]